MSSTNKPRKKTDKRKIAVRVLSLILALIMVAGMAYTIIAFLATPAAASSTATVLNTSSLNDSEDVLVSVGLMYGNSVTTGFEVTTANKFTVGKQVLTGDKEFEEIWTIDSNIISCASDANLNKYGQTFTIAKSENETNIGGYHIQIDCDDLDRTDFEALCFMSDIILQAYGFYSIPAYIYTGYALRIGEFRSEEQAYLFLDVIKALYPEKVISVVHPTANAVCVLNPYTGKNLFEFDCGQAAVIGFKAYEPDENGNTYMKTPAGNVYDGVFAFKRYKTEEVDGVSLINILPLESYIAGVLPFEISNSWPIEVQKEFAIAARSFTLTNLNSKHSSQGFDLCNTDCCEVYKGQGRVNDDVYTAVMGTKGVVISYDGSIVTSYYSSTVGGVTVSAADCWGGKEVPYLQAIETPWEDYMNHANGFWTYEVSPTALLERLQKAGWNTLQGAVANVEIEELAKNSTYVKKLRVTDIYGNSIVITNTDKVRTSLTPYVKSANFVVGKGSVEYTEQTVLSGGLTSSAGGVKEQGKINTDSMSVITGNSVTQMDYKGYVAVITSEGYNFYTDESLYVATRDTAKEYGAEVGQNEDEAPVLSSSSQTASTEENNSEKADDGVKSETKTAYAVNPENFIFVGKGWGHGVGMSQWGAYDLAVKGYKYDEIIYAYFPTVALVDYKTTKNFKR